ncbi:hypothetical protein SAMN02787118_1182 [Streptomyces mirabilis]|uniref:Uncharacterized protein n=1 Tax=Streptomyces mirabilis TaxID=68239 RepID=A0A1I2QGQ7_9ACTN|nr:hypothetical protein SAMN02787118_1182 [Streptomyces mirabilis]
MPNTKTFGEVYVSPLYLAGPTSAFTGGPALTPLLDRGFAMHSDDAAIMWNQVCQGSPRDSDA